MAILVIDGKCRNKDLLLACCQILIEENTGDPGEITRLVEFIRHVALSEDCLPDVAALKVLAAMSDDLEKATAERKVGHA